MQPALPNNVDRSLPYWAGSPVLLHKQHHVPGSYRWFVVVIVRVV